MYVLLLVCKATTLLCEWDTQETCRRRYNKYLEMLERILNVFGTYLERVRKHSNALQILYDYFGAPWNVPWTGSNRGKVFWTVFWNGSVFTTDQQLTIRQIERDRYLIEKGPTIYSSPKSFGTVWIHRKSWITIYLINDAYLQKYLQSSRGAVSSW